MIQYLIINKYQKSIKSSYSLHMYLYKYFVEGVFLSTVVMNQQKSNNLKCDDKVA